jgi:hypothetical protein
MAYQLRFLKSNPISAWLNQNASILEIFLYKRVKLSPNWASDDQNRRLIRKALIKGLSAFLVKRSLCDIHKDCDIGLRPAAANQSDDRFMAGVINAPVKRYLFREDTDFEGAVQKMASALRESIPEVSLQEHKIKHLLREILSSHLFENPDCFHHAYCRRSLIQKMDKDFAGTNQLPKPHPGGPS